jgi:hypothetical protein
MKKILLFSAIYIIFSTVGLYSYDWSSKQFTVEKTEKSDIETILSLKDASGNPFTVTYKELTNDKAEIIIKLNQQFRNWKDMQIDKLSFTVESNEIQVFVLPSKYDYKEVNIVPHIPAGMLFIYSDLYKFNFRLVKDNYFIKIEGVFINEDSFSDSLVEAIKDPVKYLEKTNPLYIITKVSQMEENIQNLKYSLLMLNTMSSFGKPEMIDQKVIKRTIEIKSANPKFEVKDIVNQLEKEKFKTSKKVVNAILQIYMNEFQ